MEEWHDEILIEKQDTILASLGEGGVNLISFEKTEKGYQVLELVEHYGGTTLNQDQMERFIKELQVLAGLDREDKK